MRRIRNEEGQTLILVVIGIVVLFGFTALTVDVGRAFAEVEGLQRTADMSALSGAEALRGAGAFAAATAEANNYGTKNESTYRPGQSFASTNCEQLYVSDITTVPAWTPPPVSCSPPHLFGGNCSSTSGGFYTGCPANPCMDQYGTQYACVYARAASRSFHFLLAPVIGAFSGSRTLSGQATAVSGAGAPGGATVVPWALLDCPVLDLDGAAVVAAAQTYNPQCPAGGYAFQSQGWNGTRVSLFLGNDQSTSGNFQAASLLSPPNCPTPDQGFGNQGGGANYQSYLQGNGGACPMGPGARMHTQTGALVGPTRSALNNRLGVGVSPGTCENLTAFNNTLSDPDGDGIFAINNDPNNPNPCLVALAMVVHTNPNAPWAANAANNQYHGGCCVTSLQAPDPAQRFATLTRGSSEPLLVRRFSYFYITDRANGPGGSYQVQGVFIRATDSADNAIGASACTDSSGLCVVKLVN